MDVFEYAARQEMTFEDYLADNYGDAYTKKTTFVYDLSIAEYVSGRKGVADTYRSVVKNWRKNAEYFTEFIMSLNFMSWLNHAKKNAELTEEYANLYYAALDVAYKNLKPEEMSRVYRLID